MRIAENFNSYLNNPSYFDCVNIPVDGSPKSPLFFEGLETSIKKVIEENFDLSPRGIREMLKLNNPIYEITSAYGHFGRKTTKRGEFTWEKTDKIDLFKL